ncbi:hypothetical protein ACTFIY_002878 [Dictyostelium cf. discoideum]
MGKRKTSNNSEKEMEAYFIPKSSKIDIITFIEHISANVARDAEIDLTDYEKVKDHTTELVKLLVYELNNKKFKLDPPKNKETNKDIEEKQQSKKSLGLDEKIANAKHQYAMFGSLIKLQKDELSKELNKLNILKKRKENCKVTKKIIEEHRKMKAKEREEAKEYLSRNHKNNFLNEKYGKYKDPAEDMPFLIPIRDDL